MLPTGWTITANSHPATGQKCGWQMTGYSRSPRWCGSLETQADNSPRMQRNRERKQFLSILSCIRYSRGSLIGTTHYSFIIPFIIYSANAFLSAHFLPISRYWGYWVVRTWFTGEALRRSGLATDSPGIPEASISTPLQRVRIQRRQ